MTNQLALLPQLLLLAWPAVSVAPAAAPVGLTPPAKPNLLFINVDDLRPSIGAFGQPFMHTPHFDAFAERAVLFTRAYAVAPHCLPSRNAYMTGRRPDTSHVWSGGGLMNFRTLGPDWVTLPSFFRDQGYTAVGQGKVFHEYGNKPAPHKPPGGWGRTDTQSWSPVGLPYFDPSPTGCKHPHLDPQAAQGADGVAAAKPQGLCMCPVNQSGDDSIVANALGWIRTFAASGGDSTNTSLPFFLAVGLHRPHLPWSVPQQYFDLYNESELAIAAHERVPKGMPPIAWHSCSREEGMGSCIPAATDEPDHPATPVEQRHTRHGYYAAISYADDRVGQVLSELARSQQLAEKTIISINGDHGWQLGEGNEYCKHTLFENALRTALLIHVPWLPESFGSVRTELFELLDLFPTLQELAGFEVSAFQEGVSQAPLFHPKRSPEQKEGVWSPSPPSPRQVALAQFPRCVTPGSEPATQYWDHNNCNQDTTEQYTVMGYTMRTESGWRYTRWVPWNQTTLTPEWSKGDYGEELYDFRGEGLFGDFDMQSDNLAADEPMRGLVEQLRKQLQEEFTTSL
jgi:arylsulfatase A-like enzyme